MFVLRSLTRLSIMFMPPDSVADHNEELLKVKQGPGLRNMK